MNCVKAVLFDLDGVILDTESMYLRLMVDYNKKIGIPADYEYYISKLLGKTKDVISEYYKKDFNDNFNEEEYWKGLLKYRRDYIDSNNIEVKSGVLKLIHYLKDNEYKISIVTSNSKELTLKLLKKANIDYSIFDFIITREEVINTKPFPDLYKLALNKYNLKEKEVVAVEDSKVGLSSALSAGLDVIYVKDIDVVDEKLKHKCIYTCEKIDEIIDIIKEKRN